MSNGYDYIVVGAGSSGCVVAERLSANPSLRVLLLEAGGENGFWNRLPKGVARLVTDPRKVWLYNVAQPREEGAKGGEFWIRGKGLGGSSSVNGMIWSRGEPADYDAWETEKGATGWNASTLIAAFKQLEDHADGASELRGAGGPVHVDPAIYTYPLAERMIEAGENLGLKRVRDLNGETGPRVGLYSHNIRRGKRQSAAVTFLEPARRRNNLDVVTGAMIERIVFEDRRAVAVMAVMDGETRRFDVRGEVIVSAGTLESPLLLQRSGIGDAAHLRAAGVDVVAHSPHVGEKMLEHLSLSIPYRLAKGKGSHKSFYGLGLGRAMARYLLTGTGIMATGPFEVGAFCNVHHPDGRTDAQLYLGGYTFAVGDENNPVPLDQIDRRPGITIYGQLLRLTSEGSIRITGSTSAAEPAIEPNFLTTEFDRASAVALVRKMRAYMDAEPIGSMRGQEVLPGREIESEDDLLQSFRRYAQCGLHAIGTCRMGSDSEAVTDPRLRVNGVSGVRVVDCSVIPGHVTGNTNAPAMAIGLVASRMILEDGGHLATR